jgi:hypothetical protein
LRHPGIAGETAEELPLHRQPGGGGEPPLGVPGITDGRAELRVVIVVRGAEVHAAEGADGRQVRRLLDRELQLAEGVEGAELPQVGAVGHGDAAELLRARGQQRASPRSRQQVRVGGAVGRCGSKPQLAQRPLQRHRLQRVFAHRHQQRPARRGDPIPRLQQIGVQVGKLDLETQQLVVAGKPLAVTRPRLAQGLLQTRDALLRQALLFLRQQGTEVALPHRVHHLLCRATQLLAAQPPQPFGGVQAAEHANVQHRLIQL